MLIYASGVFLQSSELAPVDMNDMRSDHVKVVCVDVLGYFKGYLYCSLYGKTVNVGNCT